MAEPPSRDAILRAIRRILEEGWFIRTDHFLVRARQRDVWDYEAVAVIESGRIVRGPSWNADHSDWEVTMEGTTVDGDTVTVGLAVDLEDDKLYLVTVY